MAISVRYSADRSRALPQGRRGERTGDPLLHHWPSAGCSTVEPSHPPALGNRKQTALGCRCKLQRILGSEAAITCSPEFLAAQTHRALNLLCQDKTCKLESMANASNLAGTILTYSKFWEFRCVGLG